MSPCLYGARGELRGFNGSSPGHDIIPELGAEDSEVPSLRSTRSKTSEESFVFSGRTSDKASATRKARELVVAG